MYKVAVMGDRDSIYGFASVGLDIFPVLEDASAKRTLTHLAEGGYAIIYITERLFSFLETEIQVYKEKTVPAIIPIPGAAKRTGIGVASIKKSVEAAIGSDILFGKEKEYERGGSN